jgi:multiple antibiotic resistance protein
VSAGLVLLWNATRLVNVLVKTGTNIITRLSAFILMAIGVQIMWNGLHSGLPLMLAPTVSR